jgi:hypothetical protein
MLTILWLSKWLANGHDRRDSIVTQKFNYFYEGGIAFKLIYNT